MALLIKLIILGLFALVVFARASFASVTLYWATFALMFALVPLWWLAEYWVSKKKAKQVIKEEIKSTFFVAMIMPDVNDDLQRGRLCITDNELILVSKIKAGFKIVWSEKKKNIKQTATGKVAGSRNGFTLYTDKTEHAFAYKNPNIITEAINKV